MLAAANWIQSMRQRAMAAYAKIFSDLVTSNADTVATWQIGSGSPKVRFGLRFQPVDATPKL